MNVISSHTFKLLQLLQLKGVGSATVEKLIRSMGKIDQPVTEIAPSIAKRLDLNQLQVELSAATSLAHEQVESAEANNVRVISVLDEEYPALLRETTDRPLLLYVKGRLHGIPLKSIAVIGTRQPTEHGVATCERITAMFVENSWSVVSGLALGCDAVAHRTALARSGHTVAVLAHGLHTVAPKQHKKLADQIVAEGGALITEYGFGMNPFAYQYVKRDRIQAGLAQGVVLIQSDETGGSMHASRAAVEYGRLLIVARPTNRDISNTEPKIAANSILCGNDVSAKTRLLRCDAESLKLIFPITSREDYPLLLSDLSNTSAGLDQRTEC